MSARLALFDDPRARRWAPFADTRPVGELRYGAMLLRERVERAAGRPCGLHLCGEDLAGWDEPGSPPAGRPDGLAPGVERVVWSSRAVPLAALPDGTGDATFVVAGRVAGWRLAAGSPGPRDADLLDPEHARPGHEIEVEGEWLDWPWTLVERNAARLAADLADLHGTGSGPAMPEGVIRVGDHAAWIDPEAAVEPGVVFDVRDGPIRLDEGVRVEGPARLVGPLHLGPGCTVFGGTLARVSAGPVCKLRGEVADTVVLGFSNKAHDGFLGHALVGRWVNLGALTTNSDLKNTYSPVRVELPHGTEDTGLLKVGSFLGDHVKTGIGTLLGTGAVVGAGTNLFGGGLAPRSTGPFGWGSAAGIEPYRFDAFEAAARHAMGRRGQGLTPGVRAALERLWRREHGSS